MRFAGTPGRSRTTLEILISARIGLTGWILGARTSNRNERRNAKISRTSVFQARFV
jgi:hypothetical protein